jgi:hypothetical protein
MHYTVFRLCDGDRVEALEAHVFVRAYVDAWRALYLCEPVGAHAIESLGLAIDFGRPRARVIQ